MFTNSQFLRAALLGNRLRIPSNSRLKQACSENVQLPDVTYTAICARIRHEVKDPPIQHGTTAEVYSAYSSSRECQIESRKTEETRLYRQNSVLKSTKECSLTKALDESDPTCPLCNQAPQDLQHWLPSDRETEIFLVRTREDWIA